MSYRRFNVSPAAGNFTGLTTGAQITGTSLFMGESEKKVADLSAHIVATCTMTGATMKTKWQGSSDGTTFYDLANDPVGTASLTLLTAGTGATVTVGVPPPASVYGYKYARCNVVLTSTTAGTTNDIVSIGLNYRQLSPGE